MANIFAGTEPPAWLSHMTAQEPGQLGRIFSELVGGLGLSAEAAIRKADDKTAKGIDTNWIKELPGSIHQGLFEARMNMKAPLWRMQVQQAQLNMAEQGVRIQNEKSQLDARQTALRMQEQDQGTMSMWMQTHPTWESRQDAEPPHLLTAGAQRMFNDIRLNDAGNAKHHAMTSAIDAYSKNVTELQKLDPIAAAPFAAQIGKVPTPKMQADMDTAMAAAKAKAREQETESRPVHDENGTVIGYVVGDKFQAKKADKAAPQKKISAGLKSELDMAQKRVDEIQKAMLTASPKQLPELRNQYEAARKFYNRKVKEADEATGGGAPQAAPAPAPQAFNPAQGTGLASSVAGENAPPATARDPLGLGIGQ